MSREMTQDKFLKDVQSHVMTVVQDDGLHRHLVFRQSEPSSWLYWFEIVTWPGALCIRGDCGTYVFSRIADMFKFFRHDSPDGLYINDGYWAEKLIASDSRGRHADGVMRFDPDEFRDAVNRHYVDHVRHNMRGMPDERKALRYALEDEVLSSADEGEPAAMRAACDFEHDGFRLTDFWEVDCRKYTVQFIWSLYAISWAIKQYDARDPTKSAAA